MSARPRHAPARPPAASRPALAHRRRPRARPAAAPPRAAGPRMPIASRSPPTSEVNTVTAAILVSGSASTAAAIIAGTAGGVDREVRRGERGTARAAAGHRRRDVVQLEVEEDVDARRWRAPSRPRRALGAEELEADLTTVTYGATAGPSERPSRGRGCRARRRSGAHHRCAAVRSSGPSSGSAQRRRRPGGGAGIEPRSPGRQ